MQLLAQDSKPELPFKVLLSDNEEKLEIEWNTCLENSRLFVLTGEQVLSSRSICQDNASIDFSAFEPGVYTIRIEHYTGLGERRVVKHLNGNLSFIDLHPDKPKLEFSLLPNPAQNQFSISAETCLENSVLSIQDLNGRLVKTMQLCKNGFDVDISGLAAGMYFIKIEHYTGIGVQRLIKE
jgi:hypothetical protein